MIENCIVSVRGFLNKKWCCRIGRIVEMSRTPVDDTEPCDLNTVTENPSAVQGLLNADVSQPRRGTSDLNYVGNGNNSVVKSAPGDVAYVWSIFHGALMRGELDSVIEKYYSKKKHVAVRLGGGYDRS